MTKYLIRSLTRGGIFIVLNPFSILSFVGLRPEFPLLCLLHRL